MWSYYVIDRYVGDTTLENAKGDMNPLSYIVTKDRYDFTRLINKLPSKYNYYINNKERFEESAWKRFDGIKKLYKIWVIARKYYNAMDKSGKYSGEIKKLGAKLGGFDLRK